MSFIPALRASACLLVLSLATSTLHARQPIGNGFAINDDSADVDTMDVDSMSQTLGAIVRFPGEQDIMLTLLSFDPNDQQSASRYTPEFMKRIVSGITGYRPDAIKEVPLGAETEKYCVDQGLKPPHCFLTFSNTRLLSQKLNPDQANSAVLFLAANGALLQAIYNPYAQGTITSATPPLELMQRLAQSITYSGNTHTTPKNADAN